MYRSRDDLYKFMQTAEFDEKLDWERYWNGPEFIDFRVLCSGWFQVPVIYTWNELVVAGGLPAGAAAEPVTAGSDSE